MLPALIQFSSPPTVHHTKYIGYVYAEHFFSVFKICSVFPYQFSVEFTQCPCKMLTQYSTETFKLPISMPSSAVY